MDDLLSQMQKLLSSKEGQEQIKSMAEMMGVSDNLPDMSNLSNMFNQNSSEQNNNQNQNTSTNENSPQQQNSSDSNSLLGALGGIDINMLMNVQKILTNIKNDDPDTQLLLALKPHFRQERQNKIDKAVKILQLLSVLPLIKESGLLGGLFSDGNK